jgi:hypothetical protein
MSDTEQDVLEELSESLDIQKEVQKERSSLEEFEEELEDLSEEGRKKVQEDDGEVQKKIEEAFTSSLGDKHNRLTSESEVFNPGEFDKELETFTEEFESVLRHPGAQKVVKNIEDWLVESGAKPFDNKSREELVDVVKNEMDAVEQAAVTAENSFDILSKDLEETEGELAELIKEKLSDVNTVSGIKTTASDLDELSKDWPYPWEAEFSEEGGKIVRKRTNNLILTRIQEVIKEEDSFDEFITLAKSELSIESRLNDIEAVTSRIDNRFEALQEAPAGTPVEVGEDELKEGFEEAESVEEVERIVKEVLSILEVMNDAATESIDKFAPPDGEIPRNIFRNMCQELGQNTRNWSNCAKKY